jgi:hypothetical protein
MPRRGVTNVEQRRRRSRREFIGLLILLTCLYGFALQHAESRLRRAMSEAEADTPNWMLRDLSADRKVIPEELNSARIVLRVVKTLPGGWVAHRRTALYERLSELNHQSSWNRTNERLTPSEIAEIRRELADASGALREAKPLATAMMEGRSKSPDTRSMYDREMTVAQSSRRVVRLLQLDAFLRAEMEEPDAAIADCRMIFNVARSIGDEPELLSQLVRIGEGNVAIKMLERALAHGEPSERELRELDAYLAEEADFPHLLIAFRGERADRFEFMKRFQAGEVPETVRAPGLLRKLLHPYLVENQYRELQFMNQAVELAKSQDITGRPQAWETWKASVAPTNRIDRIVGSFASILAPSLESASEADTRHKSRLACARTMIALERYRRRNHSWPDTLAPLVPEFLPVLPLDPWVGRPIRMSRVADGLVIYSVGPNLVDDGGKNDPQLGIKMTAIDDGYRLWDVESRHVPASASHHDPWDDDFPIDGTEPH